MNVLRYDVVVVGGGVVGACFVRGLMKFKNIRIAWVDPKLVGEGVRFHEEGLQSLRTFTLTQNSVAFLRDLNCFPERDARVFESMRVWDEASGRKGGFCRFDRQGGLAVVVDSGALHHALWRGCWEGTAKAASVDVDEIPATVVGVTLENRGHVQRVTLRGETDEKVVDGRLVVIADGARSPTRARLGFPWFVKDYGQRALVANVRTHFESPVAWQRFLPTGPIALLPTANPNIANLIWTNLKLETRRLESASRSCQLQLFNQALSTTSLPSDAERPPKLDAIVGPTGAFNLFLGHATRYVGTRSLLIGDAAHSVHPLAGQGVNLGIADAGEAAQAIGSAMEVGRDPGDPALLLRIQQTRMFDNVQRLTALHALNDLFGSDREPLASLRSLALRGINKMPLLKRAFIRFADGH
eukprot:CAMPEP_0184690378 /NCGR_PEP_ID=MMETSP0312-20130426/31159_1 /TAXON_ID=31354 /ORGANISM="Compsopogon coeruleus, Strain SAG 36.94" /LENGTH=412 /DNA_ID=CAMNT_0027147863 /DNA_START=42 /DNA_END=1280 /DNA_ORIENTATION=+